MKNLKSLPKVTEFFTIYASLALSIRRAGFFAQLVSAATEIGIIFSLALNALAPIFPSVAPALAMGIAIIGTMVIEGGLRLLTPHTVDALLYRRFSGLHLPMTIAIWLLTAVLLGTSGYFSFTNSKTIVNDLTPEAEERTTEEADSTLNVSKNGLAATFRTDSLMIAESFASRIAAEKAAFAGQVKARQQELANLEARETRTGKSYASMKERKRQAIADLEAAGAAKLAQLEAERAAALVDARKAFKADLSAAQLAYQTEADSIAAFNNQAAVDRAATVSSYGGGLGWFTVACLFIFVSSVVLERIHRKGSGIEETVELSQYDLNPHWWDNLKGALRDRWNYALQSRIAAFAEKTPPAPLPHSPAELYDPTQVANVTVTLKIDQGDSEEEEGVIYIQPKRRQIGFRQEGVKTTNTDVLPLQHTKGGTKRSTKKNQSPDLRDLKQRLKDYKKRLGRHTQKKIQLERLGKPVPSRTLKAIDNNHQWVEHYTKLINEAENR